MKKTFAQRLPWFLINAFIIFGSFSGSIGAERIITFLVIMSVFTACCVLGSSELRKLCREKGPIMSGRATLIVSSATILCFVWHGWWFLTLLEVIDIFLVFALHMETYAKEAEEPTDTTE